jgi:predicted enzyme related to lactoylglutathione lyase
MAFQVDNLDAAVAAAVEQGAQVILGPTEGARGKRIVFLAGDELGGTIIELLETPASTA